MNMKTKTLISVFSICLMVLILSNCNNVQTKTESKTEDNCSEEQIISMLKSFYTGYINANAELNRNESDSIEKRYCTPKYLNDIHKMLEEQTIDYDPFLHSQMVDLTMLENIRIKKDSIQNDIYYFSYFRPYYKKYKSIKLRITKENDCCRIDSIFLDYTNF